MARLAGKALEYDMANTILEDSEPEREAEEALRKENKRKRREQKIKKKQEGGNQPEASNVIILSDSQGGSVVLDSTPKNVGQSILAISDTVVALPKVAAVPTTNAMGHDLPPSPCSEKIQNLLIQSSPISPVHGQIALSDNAPIDLDASTTELPERVFPGFNLARFAFDKQASALSKLGPSHPRPPLGTSSSEENIPTARAPKASKTPLPPFASSFTQSQLAALSKCIVCNLAWTARKTVPVKMTHIKSCARKNGWNDETITTGLTKEIGHLLPLVRNDGVRDSKIRRVNERGEMNKDDSYTPKTLLEDVVNEGAAKKRRKRGQDMDFVAVAHPQDAHAAIIQRAKTLLGPPKRFPDQTQDEANPSTQTFRPSRLGVSGTRVGILGLGMLEDQGTPAEMHVIPSNTQDGELKASRHNANKSFSSTQIFQPSALARRFPKLPIPYSDENTGLFDTHVAEGTRPLPMTQASSKEGLVTRPENIRPQPTPGMTDVHTLFQNTINPARPSKYLTSSTKPLLATTRASAPYNTDMPSTSYSANDEPPPLPMALRKRLVDLDHRLTQVHKESQYKRDLVYPTASSVFKMNREKEEVRRDHARLENIDSSRRKQRPRRPSSPSRSRSASRSRKLSNRSESRSPREIPGKTARGELGDRYSRTLDRALHRIIKEDNGLYERILRYEPIHLDVFLDVAGIQEIDGRGFRLKLRAFLDRQAINFYGDSTMASDRKRYK